MLGMEYKNKIYGQETTCHIKIIVQLQLLDNV